MTNKPPNRQLAGIMAHAEEKHKKTIGKVNRAIDTLKERGEAINFTTISKEANVSRATLYNNPQIKERIVGLKVIAKSEPLDNDNAAKHFEDGKIASLRLRIIKLEDDKKKLIEQLVDYEELKNENDRLKKQLARC